MLDKLPKGTQIIRKYESHNDPGFVTSGPTEHGGYYCRFWKVNKKGKAINELQPRNRQVSDLVLAKHIVVQDSVPWSWVDEALAKYT